MEIISQLFRTVIFHVVPSRMLESLIGVENMVREKEPIDSDGGSLSKAEEYLSGKTMGILAGAPRWISFR